MESRRGLARLFDVAARGRRELTRRWSARGPARSATIGAARRRPPGSRPPRQRLCLRTVAGRPSVRIRDDDWGQLRWTRVFVPLLSRWYARRRGMAISVLQSANGFPRAASAPLVLPLAGFFRGTDPGGTDGKASTDARSERRKPDHDWTVREAIRTRHFWLLFVVCLCTGLGSFLVSLHQLAFAVDLGFDKLYAATVLGLGSPLAIASYLGGCVAFWTLRHPPRRRRT